MPDALGDHVELVVELFEFGNFDDSDCATFPLFAAPGDQFEDHRFDFRAIHGERFRLWIIAEHFEQTRGPKPPGEFGSVLNVLTLVDPLGEHVEFVDRPRPNDVPFVRFDENFVIRATYTLHYATL